MRCSNCGSGIPYFGRVCPYCHADKTEDKRFEVIRRLSLVLGTVPGVIHGVDIALAKNSGFTTNFFLTIAVWAVVGTIAMHVLLRSCLYLFAMRKH